MGHNARVLLQKTTNVFLCPSMKKRLLWSNSFNPSYGYNFGGTPRTEPFSRLGGNERVTPSGSATYLPVPRNAVVAPSDMMSVGDYPESDSQDGDIAFDDPHDFLSDRHKGRANVLFLDVHVEYDKQANWMKADENHRKRWNRDNLPHPETL